MKHKNRTAYLLSFVFFSMPFYVHASQLAKQRLSEVALFHRCYSQITRMRADSSHPSLQKVMNGQMSAVNACLEILDAASFVNKTASIYKINNENSVEAKSIVKTFHDFHRTWFQLTNLSEKTETFSVYEHVYQDPDEAMVFITRALMGESVDYRTILTEKHSIRALRNFGAYRHTDAVVAPDPDGLREGELIGFEQYTEGNHSWLNGKGNILTDLYVGFTTGNTTEKSYRTLGAGIAGLQSYIFTNLGFPALTSRADGAEIMPRRWAQSIMGNLLCRELPFLRTSDVSSMVAEYIRVHEDESTHVPFRSNASCMSCHASMDPMSAVLRNVKLVRTDPVQNDWGGDGTVTRNTHLFLENVTRPSDEESLHLVHKDTFFHRRPPNGQIMYRNFEGQMIKSDITATDAFDAMNKMGEFLAAQDDIYVCAAKRYLNFFTGVNVDLSDIGDPRNATVPTASEAYYRNKVIELGRDLKQHQSLKKLIKTILESEMYQSQGLRVFK